MNEGKEGKEQEGPENRLSLQEHLAELRRRLLGCLAAWLAGSVFAYHYLPLLYRVLLRPVRGLGMRLLTLAPLEGLLTNIKMALLGGLLLALPAILLEAWLFLAPALRASERRFLKYLLPAAFCFFAGGAACAYFLFLPLSLRFGVLALTRGVEPFLGFAQYFRFALGFLGCMGLLFELPLALVAACRLGLLSPEGLRRRRGYALVVGVTLAAVLTPTADALNLLLLIAPLALLYETGLWLAALFSPPSCQSRRDVVE